MASSFRWLLIGLQADLIELDQRVEQLDGEIQTAAKENETARRLQSIPGIGPITATALAASVGDGRQFQHGRDLALANNKASMAWSLIVQGGAYDNQFGIAAA